MSVQASGRRDAAGEANPIRLLLVDDHAIVRLALSAFLGEVAGIVVVGEAENADGAVRMTGELQPDVVLLNINMPPGRSGLEVIGEMLEAGPTSKILMLTTMSDAGYVQAAASAGAHGYLRKHAAEKQLISAIRAVHEGGTYYGMLENGGEERGSRLTDWSPKLSRHAWQVLLYAAQGHTGQQIADRLGIDVDTVDGIRKRIKAKLGK